jgi:hypothetical protein
MTMAWRDCSQLPLPFIVTTKLSTNSLVIYTDKIGSKPWVTNKIAHIKVQRGAACQIKRMARGQWDIWARKACRISDKGFCVICIDLRNKLFSCPLCVYGALLLNQDTWKQKRLRSAFGYVLSTEEKERL